MIKKIDWKECVEESRAFNEAVNVDTQFPREYDVILLSHVMYYFLTEVTLFTRNYSLKLMRFIYRIKSGRYLKNSSKTLPPAELFALSSVVGAKTKGSATKSGLWRLFLICPSGTMKALVHKQKRCIGLSIRSFKSLTSIVTFTKKM